MAATAARPTPLAVVRASSCVALGCVAFSLSHSVVDGLLSRALLGLAVTAAAYAAFAAVQSTLAMRRDALSKSRRKVRPVILELLVTERRYVGMLEHVMQLFILPLQKASPQAVGPIFSCWTQLHKLHVQLLAEAAAAGLDAGSRDPFAKGETQALELCADAAVNMATTFIKIAPFLQLYCTYCNNHHLALCRLSLESRKSSSFRKSVQLGERSKSSKGLTLNNYLVQPVQRICKYPLLLRELGRALGPHRAHAVAKARVGEALSGLERAVLKVNDAKRRAETIQRMYVKRGRKGV